MPQYYPKSQLITNLHTNGNEYIIYETGEEYIGPYYLTSDGGSFSGTNPQSIGSLRLIKAGKGDIPSLEVNGVTSNSTPSSIPIKTNQKIDLASNNEFPDNKYHTSIEGDVNDNSNTIYRNLPKESRFYKRLVPSASSPPPTPEDYEIGEFQRYYCSKNTSLSYFEIDLKTFKDLKSQSRTIAYELYTAFQISWSLTGDREKVYSTNKNIVALCERQKKYYGFSSIFNENYSQYYLASED